MSEPGIDALALREALLSRKVKLNPPASDEALARLEKWAGASLHEDVVAVYKQFDGFAGGNFDPESQVHVRPLERALSDEWSRRPRLAFADWSINAFVYDVDPTTGGSVNMDWGCIVAPTFAEFWSLLLTDPEKLLGRD